MSETTKTETRAKTRIGPYRLLALLGQGGMGVVHLAEHTETQTRVALKTLTGVSPEVVRSIRREIQALGRLRHPHIVRILDDGITDAGIPWYAMEFLVGPPLDEVFRHGLQPPQGEAQQPNTENPGLPTRHSAPPKVLALAGTDLWTSNLRGNVAGQWIGQTGDVNTRRAAKTALSEFGPAAASALQQAAKSSESQAVRTNAQSVLDKN